MRLTGGTALGGVELERLERQPAALSVGWGVAGEKQNGTPQTEGLEAVEALPAVSRSKQKKWRGPPRRGTWAGGPRCPRRRSSRCAPAPPPPRPGTAVARGSAREGRGRQRTLCRDAHVHGQVPFLPEGRLRPLARGLPRPVPRPGDAPAPPTARWRHCAVGGAGVEQPRARGSPPPSLLPEGRPRRPAPPFPGPGRPARRRPRLPPPADLPGFGA